MKKLTSVTAILFALVLSIQSNLAFPNQKQTLPDSSLCPDTLSGLKNLWFQFLFNPKSTNSRIRTLIHLDRYLKDPEAVIAEIIKLDITRKPTPDFDPSKRPDFPQVIYEHNASLDYWVAILDSPTSNHKILETLGIDGTPQDTLLPFVMNKINGIAVILPEEHRGLSTFQKLILIPNFNLNSFIASLIKIYTQTFTENPKNIEMQKDLARALLFFAHLKGKEDSEKRELITTLINKPEDQQ